jgi:hypothetical protein
MSTFDYKIALKLAGKLAMAADDVLETNIRNSGIAIENLKEALKNYDNYILNHEKIQ